eukprot:CAMPEP_0204651100 /NCGR_PEP_ID=MMETSP0718-20130828/12685_1 /ASSEMBLY_ACC=CAM_ASM_000674 /TAXON_ID=230516 /ORGANISM="Chaetoceros curvisetus" /LENGTH=115 /DNA_ID=CAMNT_0051674731 /DNA_START=59 /DNA_END=403 /DNA_ORIENTATION=-
MSFAVLSRTFSRLSVSSSSSSICHQLFQKTTSTSTSTIHNTTTTTTTQVRSMGVKALIKTNKAAAKRIRVRGSGSVKRNKAGASHNTGYKTRGRNNRLGQSTGIKGTGIEKRMRR